jgi:hypothetical protein
MGKKLISFYNMETMENFEVVSECVSVWRGGGVLDCLMAVFLSSVRRTTNMVQHLAAHQIMHNF